MRLLLHGALHRTSGPAALAALLLVSTGCGGSERPIVFGVVGPFQTPYGAPMRMGAELALGEINDAGGVRGRPLRLRILDDLANPDRAIAAADSLVADPEVVAVVGHVNSGAMIAAAPSYQRGLPVVAAGATSPLVSRLGEWVFRVASSDSVNAVEVARVARRMGKPIAILYENDGYGQGLAAEFRAAVVGSGGEVIESDPYRKTTEDLTPYLERMRRRGAGVVFLAGLTADATRIIRQSHSIGFRPQFLGGSGIEGLVSEGPDFDGTMVGLLFHPDASPKARAFAERFRAAYGREPDAFAALGYDATHLLAVAAREAGADRAAIRDYLAGVGVEGGQPAFAGVTGTIRFDAQGDPVMKDFAIGVVRGGQVHLAGDR